MNNNLSAGPSLEDLENTEENHSSDDTEPTENGTPTNETLTWQCPYCDFTHTKLGDLRDHITGTIEGDHEGVSGWSPTRDIVATDESGEVVRRIEGGGKRPDEDHHLDHGEKRKLIINAWFELGKERDIQAISSIIPVSEQYVGRLTKQLEEGEITTEEYRSELDWDVRNELAERLEAYYDNQDTSTTQMSLSTSEDEEERGAKKKKIINAWLLDRDISPSDLDEILNSSYEYIRREVKQLKDGEISQEELKDAADETLQTEIKNALEVTGVNVQDLTVDTDPTAPTTDEASDQPEYMGALEDANKKNRILNSILLERDLDEDFTNTEIAGAANSSTQYAQRLTKEVREGEITDSDLQDAADEELQQALEEYYEANGIIDAADESEAQSDIVDIDLSNEDDPFESVDVSKKEALVNVFLFDAQISKADAGKLAGASTEYARQTFNGIQDGEHNPGEYLNERIQNTLEQLDESGELDAFFSDEEPEDAEEEQDVETEVATTETPETTDTTSSTGTIRTTDTTRTPDGEALIPASELEEVRDTAELLLRQAEYEADAGKQNAKAEFIAKEIRDEINTLLETA